MPSKASVTRPGGERAAGDERPHALAVALHPDGEAVALAQLEVDRRDRGVAVARGREDLRRRACLKIGLRSSLAPSVSAKAPAVAASSATQERSRKEPGQARPILRRVLRGHPAHEQPPDAPDHERERAEAERDRDHDRSHCGTSATLIPERMSTHAERDPQPALRERGSPCASRSARRGSSRRAATPSRACRRCRGAGRRGPATQSSMAAWKMSVPTIL